MCTNKDTFKKKQIMITKLFKITIPVEERRTEVFGYFANADIGLELAKGKGWYRGGGYSTAVDVIKLSNGDYVEVGNVIPSSKVNDKVSIQDAKREAALGKLTEDERKLLGL